MMFRYIALNLRRGEELRVMDVKDITDILLHWYWSKTQSAKENNMKITGKLRYFIYFFIWGWDSESSSVVCNLNPSNLALFLNICKLFVWR